VVLIIRPSNDKNKQGDMTIVIDKDRGFSSDQGEQVGLECPYCSVYAHMTPQSVPDAASLLRDKPEHVGLVYKCSACDAPVFLRFAVREYGDDGVELNPNFVELERPKERFAFSYLPKHTEILFREALSCYSNNNFNAFASMCRRSSISAFDALGEGGKLRAFEEVMVAQDIAGLDDESFAPIKSVLFGSGQNEDLPMLNRAQAGILLEVLKDMFYQCFVRHGKLSRAIKVRRFFVSGDNGGMASA
jgi:DNA-directed RNA polymerase subunit RPC12/RpoP